MSQDKLNQLWSSQENDLSTEMPNDIIKKAQSQRYGQFMTIGIMVITILILIAYTLYYSNFEWSNFTFGLSLMILSLVFRVVLEYVSLYRKEGQLLALDHIAFRAYLKKYYQMRMRINYIVTPICFGVYIIGFVKVIPYLKEAFSKDFFNYIFISGVMFLIVLVGIIVHSTVQENRFLKRLNEH